jgi:hypothetical protein
VRVHGGSIGHVGGDVQPGRVGLRRIGPRAARAACATTATSAAAPARAAGVFRRLVTGARNVFAAALRAADQHDCHHDRARLPPHAIVQQ